MLHVLLLVLVVLIGVNCVLVAANTVLLLRNHRLNRELLRRLFGLKP